MRRRLPVVRTYVPVAAGTARMPYRKFVGWNISGAVAWVVGMTLVGALLGQIPGITHSIDMIMILVIAISLLPLVLGGLHKRGVARRELASSQTRAGVQLVRDDVRVNACPGCSGEKGFGPFRGVLQQVTDHSDINGPVNWTRAHWRQLAMIIGFYLVNFGLWEVLAPRIGSPWASFSVYVVLVMVVLLLFRRSLAHEWRAFSPTLRSGRFWRELSLVVVLSLALSQLVVVGFAALGVDILPENSENFSTQMATVPVALSALQACVFAPLIEEVTFRHSIIGKPESTILALCLGGVSWFMFIMIHVAHPVEFLYYVVLATALTLFYLRFRNVFASMALHCLVNVVGVVFLALT